MIRQIPVTLPTSPTKRDKNRHVEQLDVPTVDDYCYGTPEPTPALQRELYRTCLPDKLRQSPDGASTPENDRTTNVVDRSVQAFNTPFPVKGLGEIVRTISAIDDNSQSTSSIPVPPRPPAPLSGFRLAVLQPPTPFLDSQIPVPDVSNETPPEVVANQTPVVNVVPVPRPPVEPEERAVEPAKEIAVVEALPPQQAPPPSPPPLVINVEYTSWSLIPTRKFSGLFIDGRNVATGLRANSSRIVERIDFLIVKSASGAVIRLIGPPDEKRMLKFYISRSLVSLFSKGFPSDWSVLIESEMNRLKNASEGIRKLIINLVDDLTSSHPPLSHSRDITLASASLLSTQQTTIKKKAAASYSQKKNQLEKVDEDKTITLPPIVENPDSEEPRVGSHLFPIETFTPKNKADLSSEDEIEEEEDEDEVREEDDLESSSSMIESVDLSEADAREHYIRRRARQGNKAAKQKPAMNRKKPSPVPKAARESNAAKRSKGATAKKPVTAVKAAKKSAKTQKKTEVLVATVVKGKAVKKIDIGKNSLVYSARKDDHPSLSTDLNTLPPSNSNSKARSGGKKSEEKEKDKKPSVEVKGNNGKTATKAPQIASAQSSSLELPTSSQQSSRPVAKATTTRKRKEPSPAEVMPQQKVNTRASNRKQPEIAVESEKTKKPTATKRRSQESLEPVEQAASPSKRPKRSTEKKAAPPQEEEPVKAARTTRARQAVPEKMSVVLVEKIPAEEDIVPKTRRRGKAKNVVESDVEPTPPKQPSPPKAIATRGKGGKKVPAGKQKEEEKQAPKTDEYEFLPESPVKKVAAPNNGSGNNRGRGKKKQTPPILAQNRNPSPPRQKNPLKAVPVVSQNGSAVRQWSSGEIDRLKRAIIQVPTKAPDYWKSVGNMVATRSEEECFAMYNKRMDIQKAAHCEMMMTNLQPNAETSINCPPLSPPEKQPAQKGGKKTAQKKQPETKGGKKIITAGVGTLKRREQIRAVVEEGAAEDWYDAKDHDGNDAASNLGGGLTQSERAALIGGNFPLITPSGGTGSHSMVTAGGQALSGLDSEPGAGHSMISSALEVPVNKNKERHDADKLVQRMRGTGAGPAKSQAKAPPPAGQTLRKKAMALDHLSPMVGKMRGFLPQNVSTPHVPAAILRRNEDDDDEDTLPESPSTLTDHQNKKKNRMSPIIYRR